jgi:hypothetical protein
MMWQRCADHEQKQELGGVTITRGLAATRPITEVLLCHKIFYALDSARPFRRRSKRETQFLQCVMGFVTQ